MYGVEGKDIIMDKKVVIDKTKCVGCGLCKEDCVGMDIFISDGKAEARGQTCILCGHCVAICPQNAISITGSEDITEPYEEQTRLNPNELLSAIKTRRSIRNFKLEEIPDDVIDMIIEAGRLAPTGSNAQGTSYIILKDKLKDCEKIAVSMFRRIIGLGKVFIPRLKNMNIDDNFFFKKAPVAIVILGKDKVSASLAAENMAFMAEANGLGVLFSGFFTICYNLNKRIRKIIGINDKGSAVTTIVLGYSTIKYFRTASRKPAKITRA